MLTPVKQFVRLSLLVFGIRCDELLIQVQIKFLLTYNRIFPIIKLSIKLPGQQDNYLTLKVQSLLVDDSRQEIRMLPLHVRQQLDRLSVSVRLISGQIILVLEKITGITKPQILRVNEKTHQVSSDFSSSKLFFKYYFGVYSKH